MHGFLSSEQLCLLKAGSSILLVVSNMQKIIASFIEFSNYYSFWVLKNLVVLELQNCFSCKTRWINYATLGANFVCLGTISSVFSRGNRFFIGIWKIQFLALKIVKSAMPEKWTLWSALFRCFGAIRILMFFTQKCKIKLYLHSVCNCYDFCQSMRNIPGFMLERHQSLV